MAVPKDFVPENSDIMTPEEEYELVKILEEMEGKSGAELEAMFVDAPRPGSETGACKARDIWNEEDCRCQKYTGPVPMDELLYSPPTLPIDNA